MQTLLLLAVVVSVGSENFIHKELYVRSTQQFIVKAYEAWKSNNPANFLMSPLLLQSLLALNHAGARNGTAEEISRALFLPMEQLQDVYATLLSSARTHRSCPAHISHKVFMQNGHHISEHFKQIAHESYRANIEFVDFFGNTELATRKVNRFNYDNMHREHFFTKAEMQDEAFFVSSTLEFNCGFYLKCPGYSKVTTDFHVNERDVKDVDMAEFWGNYKYFESKETDAKFLEVPFCDDEEVVITIVLPNRIQGLAALEDKLPQVLERKDFVARTVIVTLPDFHGASKIGVMELLKEMGVRRIFDASAANFGGITKSNPIYISDLSLKATFNLTFPGTLSTKTILDLYTSASSVTCPKATHAVDFKVDRPYIYTISDKRSGSILFLGRVMEPETLTT